MNVIQHILKSFIQDLVGVLNVLLDSILHYIFVFITSLHHPNSRAQIMWNIPVFFHIIP